MLTILTIVRISSNQSRIEAGNSAAGLFVPINKLEKPHKNIKKQKDKPPHSHSRIVLGSQYAARANWMYGVKLLKSL
jgi:hypothetical protein